MEEMVLVDKQKIDMFIMSNQKYFPAEISGRWNRKHECILSAVDG